MADYGIAINTNAPPDAPTRTFPIDTIKVSGLDEMNKVLAGELA